MTAEQALGLADIRSALAELDALTRDEYPGCGGLEGLLADSSPDAALRLQRVIGITLKRPFADRVERRPDVYTQTGACHLWPWKEGTLEASALVAPREFALLEELRKPGPWNEPSQNLQRPDPTSPITWEVFKADVDTERGLFKIAILYALDRVNWREIKTTREYLDAEESRNFEAGLDIADLLASEYVLGPLLLALGVPTLAVGIALIGLRYGYRKVTDPSFGRLGDDWA